MMAAAPTDVVQSFSSSSSSASRWSYDVFLSFRGEDTRDNFTRKLYDALVGRRIETFKDDEKLKIGDLISEALKKAIKESRFAIIIFSRNYGNSRWCLEELALIMECWEKHHGQKVFPVFLKGVEGSDVRRQKGSFEEPFRKHQERFEPEMVERWRSALKIAGELRGWNLKDEQGDEEKLIKRIVKDVSDALSERPLFPKPVIEMPTESIEIQPSTQCMLQQILECIGDHDPCFAIIGVFGMGGVGKTTLAKQVNNRLEKDLARGVKIPFEIVIMVTVSATPNLPSIQTSIGKRLGLIQDNIEANALFEALRKKKFLLILDDVWCELKLEDVGIPYPSDENGSKILVISRNQDTCTDMGASKTIKVQPLSDAESWKLFVTKAGEHVVADNIKHFAEKIVGRCKGLPLAIVIVARAMANRHGVGVWENALREMKQSAKDLRGMIDRVFVPLKFSFDRLENAMLRSVFLYCACFPEDYDIGKDEMLNYCVGEGLADTLGSLKAARDKGEDLIESLKIACMLEDGELKGSVRMHDMMRELALWITSSEYSGSSPKFLIRIGESIKEELQAHAWLDATRISLINIQIKELPELRGTCRKLTTLIFRGFLFKVIGTFIPATNFFQHMDHLSILDLSNLHQLEYFPDSLSCLVNLKVLRLHGCIRLKALPALGMLQQLQVLDFYGCTQLHQQILGSECVGGLSNLRYLNVDYTQVSIPSGVISRLHKLEELTMFGARKIKWKVSSGDDEKCNIIRSSTTGFDCSKGQSRDEEDTKTKNMIDVEELSHLTCLTSFSICFQDIIISDWFKPLAKKIKRLELRHCRVVKQDALQALNESQNLQDLLIKDCSGVTCLPIRVGGSLIIENCEELEVVLDGADDVYHHHHDSLQVLNLKRLRNLKRMVCGKSNLAPVNCYGQLTWIHLFKCNSLKMIFTKEMPRLFNNLKVIEVESCHRMEVIIEAADQEEEQEEEEKIGEELEVMISPFPRLETLVLVDLPKLVEVWINHILHCPFIKFVRVSDCSKLKKDPLHVRNGDGLLIVIEEKKKWWSSTHFLH
ncbi:disease resistance protein RPS2-like [Telopea speciosissima]|uniref:disease resistance protein RPS2-like n=1 Tax=Telopea speciosissima TaxID=54955 RepID=UPI001CC6EAD8|nr:disease resistance protein RPS2-like [Telopea speciosissima]